MVQEKREASFSHFARDLKDTPERRRPDDRFIDRRHEGARNASSNMVFCLACLFEVTAVIR
jgi:hypothetical protein